MSHFKADNLVVLMTGGICYGFSMYVPRYHDIKMENAIFFSLSQMSQIIHTCMITKNVRKLIYQNILLSCYFWHRLAPLLKLLYEKTKKCLFGIFYPSLKIFPKWPPKNKKIQNLSTTRKFYFNLGPNKYICM